MSQRRGFGVSATDDGSAVTRRTVVQMGLAGAALAAAPGAFAQGAGAHDHSGHDHSGHQGGPAMHQALIDAALTCVNRGEVCLDHCIALLSKGDTSLKDCIRSVSIMLPVCGSVARLAALEAKRLKELAKVCIDICADCEAECKKHQEHHAACKACAESCAAFIKAAGKLT